MRRIALGLGVALSAALFAGCPPTYPKCSNDEQCSQNSEVCVQGQCQQCATDAHCQEGFVCQATRCVPKPECADNAACGQGRSCQAGKCVENAPDGPCTTDNDCSVGGRCKDNRCLAPGACTEPSDCGEGQGCEAGRCVSSDASAGNCELTPIRFAFNEYSLSSEAQQQLSSLADCLKTGGALTVAGHADERGTEEYNLQLSNRRAEAVRRYLTDLGIRGVKAVGYGETQPANPGQSEDAWAENRRVELQR